MFSGNRQKRFIQRFLAAIAAIYFSFSNLFVPAPVLAFVPSPAFVPAAAQLVTQNVAATAASPAGGAALTAALANPYVFVGAIAIGAAWYYWSQSQNQQLQNKAVDKFCIANPSDPDCGSASYQVNFINPNSSCSVFISSTFQAPFGYAIIRRTESWFACGTNKYAVVHIFNSSGGVASTVGGGMEISSYPQVSRVNQKPFSEWSQEKRSAAVGLLTPDDVLPILQSSSQGGILKAGDNLQSGAYIFPEVGQPSYHPSTVVPEPDPNIDTDGDSIPDEEEKRIGTNPNSADTDGDGIPDGQEIALGLNPLNPDTDGDGIPDGQDTDANGNGVPDAQEVKGEIPNFEGECAECEPDFQDVPNFVSYAWDKAANKFPFDIVGDFQFLGSGAAVSNVCPKYTFWGEEYVVCEVKNLFVGVKYVTWVGFILRMIFAI